MPTRTKRLNRLAAQAERPAPQAVRFYLPVDTLSTANLREHWTKRYKRNKAHREAGFLYTYKALHQANLDLTGQVALVRITTIGYRRRDNDNNVISCKGLRDGIAQALKRDDGDVSLTWIYDRKPEVEGRKRGVVVDIAQYEPPHHKPAATDWVFKKTMADIGD